MSHFIKKVSFKLHETYANSYRGTSIVSVCYFFSSKALTAHILSLVVEKHPFEVTETGWGEFEIIIRLHILGEKPIMLYHQLKLHPYEEGPGNMPKPTVVQSYHYDELVRHTFDEINLCHRDRHVTQTARHITSRYLPIRQKACMKRSHPAPCLHHRQSARPSVHGVSMAERLILMDSFINAMLARSRGRTGRAGQAG